MRYSVAICSTSGDNCTLVAECQNLSDAESVLSNHVAGFITSGGAIVKTKNVNFQVG